MDKNREALTFFRWHKDAAGYELAPGGMIRRRGGKMQEYDPAKMTPPLHQVFANIRSQVWIHAEIEGRRLSDDASAPFHTRGFETMQDALLAFVNEFGFLGSDRSGADAEVEDAMYLSALVGNLHSIMRWIDFSSKESRLKAALKNLGVEDRIAGPNLRMVIEPARPHNRMQVHYEPESLYAWMWLRTADDFSSGVDWSGPPCLYCLQAMGRGARAYRPQAKFCSARHRTYFARLSPAEQKALAKEAKNFVRDTP